MCPHMCVLILLYIVIILLLFLCPHTALPKCTPSEKKKPVYANASTLTSLSLTLSLSLSLSLSLLESPPDVHTRMKRAVDGRLKKKIEKNEPSSLLYVR